MLCCRYGMSQNAWELRLLLMFVLIVFLITYEQDVQVSSSSINIYRSVLLSVTNRGVFKHKHSYYCKSILVAHLPQRPICRAQGSRPSCSAQPLSSSDSPYSHTVSNRAKRAQGTVEKKESVIRQCLIAVSDCLEIDNTYFCFLWIICGGKFLPAAKLSTLL